MLFKCWLYAREAFGFENVMFFTLGGADESVARRALLAPLWSRAERRQRSIASSRLAFRNSGEVSRAATSTP